MFAYGRWDDGVLKRSISVNPVGRVWENIGNPESFELPFWNGDHPVDGAYPLPFHPLELSDAALRSVLGLLYVGSSRPGAGCGPKRCRCERGGAATMVPLAPLSQPSPNAGSGVRIESDR